MDITIMERRIRDWKRLMLMMPVWIPSMIRAWTQSMLTMSLRPSSSSKQKPRLRTTPSSVIPKLRSSTELYVVVNGAVKHQDLAYLRANIPGSIDINHLEDRALLALQGPKAVEAITRIVPGVDQLYFMEADLFLWVEVPLWISRSGYTGEDCV